MTNGRIYKIIHTQSDICYIGMTLGPLKARWHTHKNKFKNQFKNGEKYKISIYKYFEEFGIDQFKMILIKEYDVLDKRHLEVYETLWINKMRCVNRNASFNPINRKILSQNYREANKDKIAAKIKIWCEANKSEILAKKKIYRDSHKDQITIREKTYREKNSEIIKCGCGSEIKKYKFNVHLKTKKHLNFISQNNS